MRRSIYTSIQGHATRSAVLLALALCGFSSVNAVQVPEAVTRTVAQHFMSDRGSAFTGLRQEGLVLVQSVGDPATGNSPAAVFYRVYDVDGQGFVVVAGDDAVKPILAYSTELPFPSATMPVHVAKWFEGYRSEIRDAVINGAQAVPEVAQSWQELVAGTPTSRAGERAVNPLMTTLWDQQPHVNALCPGGSVTGCVATAMAQVMKYHNHPAQGSGFHSYNEAQYGTLSANFGATTYDWGAMPNVVSSPNTAVATLMFHCGVGVDMDYSPQVSGAWMIESHSPGTNHNSEYALKNYFGYDASMQGVPRANYSEAQWISMLKADLDASRPVLYAGFGTGGGHCFVTDGYDNNDFFHFNWGWGGQANGYFEVGALNPGSTGTGGGSGGYNSGQEAIFGITPGTGGGGNPTFDMRLYNFVTPSLSTIYYGQGFSVATNILNNGTNNFAGDYCAAAFDSQNNFYGYVETLSGFTLNAGNVYNNDLTFTTAGLFSMVPGTYYVGVFYRPTGGEWVLVANNGAYTNFTQVTVINWSNIEMNSSMVVTPGTTLTQGGQVTVNLNVVNDGVNTFIGQYGVALYNLDGTWAQDIGYFSENNGLPPGYTYNPPYLTFGPVPVTIPPGTYLLAAQHTTNGTDWLLTGSSYFSNPIFVTVTGATLNPDQYEANNGAAQAYALPVNFAGNSASTNTTGSNLHVTTDLDFYKVVLPGGYDYSITARAHDSYDSDNGNSYSADALWSYSTDGSTWSAAYDDVMPGPIVVTGGGTVTFHVSPYFAGETGTYLLQLDLVRAPNVGLEETGGPAGIAVFPNPAQDRLIVDLSSITGPVRAMEFIDARGAVIQVEAMPTTRNGWSELNIASVSEGSYILRIVTDEAVRTQQIVVAR